MKKIKTQLQLTKTTVRLLQGAELTAVHGGVTRGGLSEDPRACAAVAYHFPDGIDKP
jgi:hypothetical protein